MTTAGGRYTIDSAHTQALFKIEHLGVSHQYGMFTRVEGSFEIDAADLAKSKIDISIPADSVFTAVQKRDDHLRSPDFLDAKQFPTITFKSKSVEATGANTYAVVGELTLHGVTRNVTLALENVGSARDPEAMGGAFRVGFNGEATIKRSEWNMTYMQGAGLGDEVTLLLAVEGTRAK
ncbi:MAG TPA: YceI family protein [Kofleriaceae bacterium]|nr:YceI family protein [Kofleriaceae bacterium]